MRKIKLFIYVMTPMFFLWACGGETTSDAEGNEAGETTDAEETKAVNELEYQEIVDLVYANDSGETIEWHGEGAGMDAQADLVISEGGTCGDGDCGKQLFVTNNSDQPVEAVLYSPYDLEGQSGYVARKYTIAPAEELPVGCSHLCYNGQSYGFDREIVSAVYVVDDAAEEGAE